MLSDVHQESTRCLPDAYQMPTRCLQDVYQMSTRCRPYDYLQMSTRCLPDAYQMPTRWRMAPDFPADASWMPCLPKFYSAKHSLPIQRSQATRDLGQVISSRWSQQRDISLMASAMWAWSSLYNLKALLVQVLHMGRCLPPQWFNLYASCLNVFSPPSPPLWKLTIKLMVWQLDHNWFES